MVSLSYIVWGGVIYMVLQLVQNRFIAIFSDKSNTTDVGNLALMFQNEMKEVNGLN
jgi:hypothetical protein